MSKIIVVYYFNKNKVMVKDKAKEYCDNIINSMNEEFSDFADVRTIVVPTDFDKVEIIEIT